MSLGSSARDGEIEALVVDRYLDSLLARAPGDPGDIPADLRATADRLATGLPRYHPSFRFEEDLAAQLGAAAAAHPGELVDFPTRPPRDIGAPDGRPGQVRPMVIGSVLTSAALSLAGAAWVAWRRGRPAPDPMTRVARAVARARTT